ncbi:hypothetical protein EV361DRAFT_910771 [Lentinula raphanica]|nr:hypothetical protein EV361DRAFT_910771 [Lentinula raphanica]
MRFALTAYLLLGLSAAVYARPLTRTDDFDGLSTVNTVSVSHLYPRSPTNDKRVGFASPLSVIIPDNPSRKELGAAPRLEIVSALRKPPPQEPVTAPREPGSGSGEEAYQAPKYNSHNFNAQQRTKGSELSGIALLGVAARIFPSESHPN